MSGRLYPHRTAMSRRELPFSLRSRWGSGMATTLLRARGDGGQGSFRLQATRSLPTGEDEVLGAILELDIAVGVHDVATVGVCARAARMIILVAFRLGTKSRSMRFSRSA